MFVVEVYAAVRPFVFIQGQSRREAARVFGLSRETIARMCRFDLSAYLHLPRPAVRAKMAADYTVLVPEVAA